MPITAPQVLWVNMVTSVALGLVTAFEPHELDGMRRPPRAVDRAIVTGPGIWRIMFVGLALLAYTLSEFFWMVGQGASDELARTVAMNAITIGQVFFLLNSRLLLDSSLSVKAHLGNRYLPMEIGAVVALQLLFTFAAPLQAVLHTEAMLGQGLGSDATSLVAELALSDSAAPFILACARLDNLASQRAFAKAGFRKHKEFDDVPSGLRVLMVRHRQEGQVA